MVPTAHGPTKVAKPSCDAGAEPASLMRAVRLGNREAFARLYALTSPHLFGLVLRIVRDRSDAEDVLQEVYVKAWNNCQHFDENKAHVLAWLTTISQHSAIDGLRRRRTQPQRAFIGPAEEDDPYFGLASTEPAPAECLHRRRAQAAVNACVSGLPDDQREAVALAFHHGLSHSEIAAQLGRPLGTVKSWLNRSLAQMRPALADYRPN